MSQKKGVISMKYERPAIHQIGDALSAIQGGEKDNPLVMEEHSTDPQRTIPAYEVDE
jgi:hypothetical protein